MYCKPDFAVLEDAGDMPADPAITVLVSNDAAVIYVQPEEDVIYVTRA